MRAIIAIIVIALVFIGVFFFVRSRKAEAAPLFAPVGSGNGVTGPRRGRFFEQLDRFRDPGPIVVSPEDAPTAADIERREEQLLFEKGQRFLSGEESGFTLFLR